MQPHECRGVREWVFFHRFLRFVSKNEKCRKRLCIFISLSLRNPSLAFSITAPKTRADVQFSGSQSVGCNPPMGTKTKIFPLKGDCRLHRLFRMSAQPLGKRWSLWLPVAPQFLHYCWDNPAASGTTPTKASVVKVFKLDSGKCWS